MTEYHRAANYCRAMADDIKVILERMLEIEKEVGHIWKWPDRQSCLLYALTESAEYIEAHLFATRPNDSRNNKKAEDFDPAVELFDIVMMLLRSLVANSKEKQSSTTENAVANTILLFGEYVLRHMGDIFYNMENSKETKPQDIIVDIAFLLNNYTHNSIFDLIISIYSNKAFDTISFIDVAEEKLDKILNKNRAKMEAMRDGA